MRVCPEALEARYKVEAQGTADEQLEQLLQAIALKRGAFIGKGQPNLQKAAEIVIYEFRAGTLGRITLESPTEFALWLAEGQARDAERQAKKDALAAQRKKNRVRA